MGDKLPIRKKISSIRAKIDLVQEITPLQYSWSKKRIFVGLIILAFLIGAGYYLLKNSLTEKNRLKFFGGVKGVVTKNEQPTFSPPRPGDLRNDLQQKLDLVKKQVNNLDVGDLASSSPQVKKAIEDLQSLQQLPRDQAKEACYNFCKGL